MRLKYEGRGVEHKSSVFGITMSDKLDFMSEGVAAITHNISSFHHKPRRTFFRFAFPFDLLCGTLKVDKMSFFGLIICFGKEFIEELY